MITRWHAGHAMHPLQYRAFPPPIIHPPATYYIHLTPTSGPRRRLLLSA